jgi:hypothetical protein
MRRTHPRVSRALPRLLAALWLCAAAAAAQPAKEPAPTPAQAAEAARLRAALVSAVGDHFEVARERRAGGYWLAHLRAKSVGAFSIRYKYRYNDTFKPHDPLYTFVEHETHIRVGSRGCARRLQYNSVCVGDTVILPVVVNDYTEHTFAFVSHPYEPLEEQYGERWREAEETGLYREPVPNPASQFLKYVGSRAHYSPHRSLGYTLEYYATFEAVRPGSFNLAVGVSWPGATTATPATELGASSAVPVVIVERGAPVTVVSARENVHGSTGRFSSHHGNNYMTTPVILQPGDRFTLKYFGYSRRGRSPGGENEKTLEATVKDRPVRIALLPFRVDPAQVFNEWIIESLPPPGRR